MKRMNKTLDLAGKQFGKLTVIERIENRGKHAQWLCKCECGNDYRVITGSLTSGNTKSCGCLTVATHGMARSRAYKIWRGMRERCFNKNFHHFKDYGGRGITVCEKWLTFDGFWEDMKHGYMDDLTLDRKNVNGNYEPSNCRWATMEEQQNNKRCNVLIQIGDEVRNIAEWSRFSGIGFTTIWERLKSGKSGTDLIKPVRRGNKVHASNS